MKKYIIVGMAITFICLISSLIIALRSSRKYEVKWKTAEENAKAYDELLSSSNKKSAAFTLHSLILIILMFVMFLQNLLCFLRSGIHTYFSPPFDFLFLHIQYKNY